MLQRVTRMKDSSKTIISWDQVDTVLVDMDGTLLDLAFDNFFGVKLFQRNTQNRMG